MRPTSFAESWIPSAPERAMARCEYCHFPEAHAALPFQIDHIIARQHRGGSAPANLALACLFCNSAKGRTLPAWTR